VFVLGKDFPTMQLQIITTNMFHNNNFTGDATQTQTQTRVRWQTVGQDDDTRDSS